MKFDIKMTTCSIFLIIGIYLIYTLYKPVAVKQIPIRNANAVNANAVNSPNAINANAINANAINATAHANVNVNRNQQMPLDLDRPPFIEENPTIINANEIYQDNYKDYTMLETGKHELYSNDAVLFNEKNNGNIVPLDLNDGSHRRVNFY